MLIPSLAYPSLPANCDGDDTDDWVDMDGGRLVPKDKLRLCHTCPLLDACLDYALRVDEWGIWGGTTAAQRKRIREARGIVAVSPQAAYQKMLSNMTNHAAVQARLAEDAECVS